MIERYADGDPAIVAIFDGWQPSYRTTYGVIPVQDYVYTAKTTGWATRG